MKALSGATLRALMAGGNASKKNMTIITQWLADDNRLLDPANAAVPQPPARQEHPWSGWVRPPSTHIGLHGKHDIWNLYVAIRAGAITFERPDWYVGERWGSREKVACVLGYCEKTVQIVVQTGKQDCVPLGESCVAQLFGFDGEFWFVGVYFHHGTKIRTEL
jgi:hypothetical protein